MTEATIQDQHHRPENDRLRVRVRHVVCIAVALMLTSAGAGALAQRTTAVLRTNPGIVVIHDHGAIDDGGIDVPHPTAHCRSTAPRPRVVLVAYRLPSNPCDHVVLVSDRTSPRSSL